MSELCAIASMLSYVLSRLAFVTAALSAIAGVLWGLLAGLADREYAGLNSTQLTTVGLGIAFVCVLIAVISQIASNYFGGLADESQQQEGGLQ